ncbi:signal peptidase I [Staphylococcus warneri]|uniref:signal peptidase I n=3 Tax=Staphylococcus TaxID=1279 RepID=UPI003BA392F5
MKKEIMEWVIAIAVALALVFLIGKFVGQPYTIKGDSMDPTLKDGERVVVNIMGYKIGDVKKGNVIVFHANKKDDYVKRVIGVPGDKVQYKKDQLYINGKKQDEPYLNYNEKRKQIEYIEYITGTFQVKDLANANPKSNVIPKGKYLVLGDNREVSKDSRSFGLIDKDQIVGKVSFRFWPLNEFKFNFNPDNTKN